MPILDCSNKEATSRYFVAWVQDNLTQQLLEVLENVKEAALDEEVAWLSPVEFPLSNNIFFNVYFIMAILITIKNIK